MARPIATGGGGDGAPVDLSGLANLYAGKNPPDNTLVRIEELERFNAEVVARVINHDKTLYQNSTLHDLIKTDSKAQISEKLSDAFSKDRAQSAKNGGRSSVAASIPNQLSEHASQPSFKHNLEKVLDDIEALNNTDNCLTTRIIRLEEGLAAKDAIIKEHEREIKELKMKSDIKVEIPSAPVDGKVDTGAIFQAIKALEIQLNMHKESTEADFKDVKQEIANLKVDYKEYVDNKVGELDGRLSQKIDDGLGKLGHELDRLRAEFEMHRDKDFASLENRVTALEKKLLGIIQKLNNLPSGPVGSGIDDGKLADILKRLADLENRLGALENEFSRWVKELQDMINSKPDFDQIEKMIQDRFNEIVKALTKQFADKGEMRKALKIHEKQLQNVYNVVMSRMGSGNENEEDAMFSKKPLKGLSCASCEKGLENMYGKKVEFMAWNKLPFRDPAERIARVGQGFSKMLSMLNPDQLSRYEQGSKMYNQNQKMTSSQHDPNFIGSQTNYAPDQAWVPKGGPKE